MITLADKPEGTVGLSNTEAKMARDSSQAIAQFVNADECLQLTLSRETRERIEARFQPRHCIYWPIF